MEAVAGVPHTYMGRPCTRFGSLKNVQTRPSRRPVNEHRRSGTDQGELNSQSGDKFLISSVKLISYFLIQFTNALISRKEYLSLSTT